jgi:hypothetical protein
MSRLLRNEVHDESLTQASARQFAARDARESSIRGDHLHPTVIPDDDGTFFCLVTNVSTRTLVVMIDVLELNGRRVGGAVRGALDWDGFEHTSGVLHPQGRELTRTSR